MNGKLGTSLDVMAVVTDKQSRTSEVADVDSVQVMQLNIDHVQKIAHFLVAFGSKDSTGKFHVDPTRLNKSAMITIKDPVFSQLFTDAQGNPKHAFTTTEWEDIFDTYVVPAADKFVWEFAEVEVTRGNKQVYKKTKQPQ